MIANLYEETVEVLRDFGIDESEVLCVVDNSIGEYCTWEEFIERAKGVDYETSFGNLDYQTNLVNPFLRVVFKDDSWLERSMDEDEEYWMYKSVGDVPTTHNPSLSLVIET